MKKEILVTVDHEETRAAVLEESDLMEIYIERPLSERVVGNIYKGRVENVLPGMQAAFVNIGLEKNAFLYVDDAYPAVDGDPKKWRKKDRPAIDDLLRPGQELIVQVVKEATGTKGARITRSLSIPGRYLVFMPTVDYVGVSRKISDEKERRRLKKAAGRIKPDDVGVIVRTVAEGKKQEDLDQDIAFLKKVWNEIKSKSGSNRAPHLLHKDMSLVYRIVRDFLTHEVDQIYIDDKEQYEKALDLADGFSPQLKGRIRFFRQRNRSLFEVYGINEELEKTMSKKVWLRSGGYIIIDRSEALTAIDVNTGKYVGKDELEKTVYKTNLEAADEIARQIRLRDIGGIIIIDFIDMQSARHRNRVVKAFEDALDRDRTKATVLGITQLGLVEMTRKKGRKSLHDLVTRECPYCDGRGTIQSEEHMSRKVRRDLKRVLRHSKHEAILIEVHPSVAALVIGAGGVNLKELERSTGKSIFVKGSEDCHIEEMRIIALGSSEDVEEQARPVKTGQVMELEVEEPHVSNIWDGIARVEGYVIDIEGAGNKVGEKVKVEITKAFRTYAKGRILEKSAG